MRTPEFRAWDDLENKMVYNVSFDLVSGSWCYLNQNCRLVKVGCKKGKVPVMQYTGLKDKNGVKIFEDDILKFSRYWSDHYVVDHTQVFYVDELAMFCFTSSVVFSYQLASIHKESSVVGSIYENPELLKGSL
jgi:uncharacterized phage protein (TIGR01671 family)